MIPHSPNDDAWGVTRIPLAVIKNGSGPTVVLEGGNHGDEYEGPIAICELIRELDPGRVQGRLILMPANNVHAVDGRAARLAGRRPQLQPHLPGRHPRHDHGADRGLRRPTTSIRAADAFLDLHSGGSSLDILPSAIIEPTDDPALHARNVAAVRAFDAPYTRRDLESRRAAHRDRRRLPRRAGHRRHRDGGRRHGVDRGARDLPPRRAQRARPSRRAAARATHRRGAATARCSSCPAASAFVFATMDGVFEPLHENGTQVRAGELAGRIHCTWDPTRAPDELFYQADGILYGRRQPGRVRPGNCCLVVAAPYRGALA